MDKELRISISTGTVFKTLLMLTGAYLLYYLRDLALVVFTAVVLASAVKPGVKFLMRYKFARLWAVAALYAAFFLFFFIVFYFFIPTLMEDVASFAASLPTYLAAFGHSGAFDAYARILGVASPDTISITPQQVFEAIKGPISPTSGLNNAVSAIATIFGGVTSVILIFVFSFYLAVQDTGVPDFLRVVTPKAYQPYALNLWHRAEHKIGLWMQGQILLCVLIGIIVFLGLEIFGVRHALLLAIFAGMMEIIPVFGPTLSAIPAVAIGFIDGGVTLGLIVLLIYVIAQQFENHLIYPLVVTRVVGVPPLLVILGLIIGAKLAGILGIILSVPIAAMVQELAKDIENGTFGKPHEEPEHV